MKYTYIGIIAILLLIVGWLLYERHKKNKEKEPPKNAEGFIAAIKKIIDGFRKVGRTVKSFFNRFKYFGQGVGKGAQGIAIAVKNSAIMGGTLIADSFDYGFEGAKYVYILIVCTIERIKVLHYCFVFYIFDFVIYMIHITIMSVCALLDAVFRIESRLGYTLLSSYQYALNSMDTVDNLVYDYTGLHILNYPDYILNLCYRCVASRDELNRKEDVIKYDVNVKFPKMTDEFVIKFRESGERFKRTFAPF